MKRVRVQVPRGPHGLHAYDVLVGEGALDAKSLGGLLQSGSHGVVVSSREVMGLHGPLLLEALRHAGFDLRSVIELPDGEKAKTVDVWDRSIRALARARVDRSGFVIAFGGGTVGDAAGFLAATYMRGIRLVQIPTTLLSMVDSSVGGKTGLNLSFGKNLVGAFHQPSLVLEDLRFLKTLPMRERQSGAYEILKAGLLRSETLLSLVERTRGLSRATARELETAIALAVKIKARIVERDERESGDRVLLNLGHTLGHALEAATSYRVFTHGEAVGYGMEFALDLGTQLGVTKAQAARRMKAAVLAVGTRTPLHSSMAAPARRAALLDKKRAGAKLFEVLVTRPGRPVVHQMNAGDFAEAASNWIMGRDTGR